MKEKKRIFFRASGIGFIKDLLAAVVFVILMLVFWAYAKYVAFAFSGIIVIILIINALSFVIVTDTEISLFSWGRIATTIKLDDLMTIDTHAGKPDTMTFFGAEDLITCCYGKKLMSEALTVLGIDKKDIEEFISGGADKKHESGKWTLEKENVNLDILFGKKKYIHRRVNCYAKDDIFG